MHRRSLLAGAVGLSALAARAAPPARPAGDTKRLAVLLFDSAESWDWLRPPLKRELGALGWIEGSNLSVEWRHANGDSARLRSHAAQLIASAPDAILTRGT